jgi:hypothetical protein
MQEKVKKYLFDIKESVSSIYDYLDNNFNLLCIPKQSLGTSLKSLSLKKCLRYNSSYKPEYSSDLSCLIVGKYLKISSGYIPRQSLGTSLVVGCQSIRLLRSMTESVGLLVPKLLLGNLYV